MRSNTITRICATLLLALALIISAKAVVIPASQATTLTVPGVPGDGVFIKLYNGIGGGAAPTPAILAGRNPDGTTLSPYIDFPSPGAIINVGQSFNVFFANTANPPDQVDGIAARNFILDHHFFIKVTPALDRNPATPEIDIQLGVGSDDGFHLTVGTTFIGSAGDRSFSTSAYDVSFAQPGLYEVTLLFAANSVGQSGLEFYWAIGATGLQLVPQAAMYTSAVVGQQLITFEENPLTTVPTDQYRAKGVVFNVTGGNLQITNAFPNDFVPVTQPSVLASPTTAPALAQTVELNFVAPGTALPGITDLVQLYVIDADVAPGARVVAINQHGQTVYDQRIITGGGAQQQITISAPQIIKVIVELGGAGADTAAIDNVAFNTPVVADLVPPVVMAARIFTNRVEVDFQDAVGLNRASMVAPTNYVLTRSGGDGILGNANDVTIAISSVTIPTINVDTVRLTAATVLPEDVYRLRILPTPGVIDNAGNLLDGDNNGTEGGEFSGTLTLDTTPASVTLDMQGGSDTGVSNTDNITSLRQPVFDLTVSEAGLVGLDYNGGGVDITQQFNAGTYPIPPLVPLADGTYTATVTFTAVTPLGSPATASLTFTIDGTGPALSNVTFNGLALPDGSIVRAAGTLRVDANDATGVNRVEFFVRPSGGANVLLNSDTTAGDGFTAIWDAGTFANGAYVFTIRAFDQFNTMNEVTRAVTLTFNLGPVITGTTFGGVNIADGAAVTGTGKFGVQATDSDGLNRVEFFYKTAVGTFRTSLGTDSNAADGFDALWNVESLSDGPFDLIARVFDQFGAFTEISRRVNLALALPAAPVIVTPVDGITVQPATIQVTGTAPVFPALRIYRNGERVFTGNAQGNGTFSASVPLVEGQNLIYAESANRAGASAPSNPVLVTRMAVLPTLAVAFAAPTVVEGASRNGTLTISNALGLATTFTLTSARANRLNVPESVTISAGDTLAAFTVQALQNQVVELPVSVGVAVSAPGFDAASASLQIVDDDQPGIVVALDRAAVSERDGSPALHGTITLDRATPFPLRLIFSATPGTDVILPPQVDIPTDSLGAIFPIGVVNNTLIDGPRTVAIAAQLLDTYGANVVSQSAPVTLTIHDDDGPSLALAVDRTLLVEGANPAATATVTRSPVTASAVLVTLASSDTTELTAPATVTIPANQPSVSFPLQAVADGTADGNQPATLTASASGFSPASKTLTVTDIQKPDLFVDLIAPPTGGETDTWIDVRILLRNQGAVDAQGPYTQRIYLSSDSLPGDDVLLTQANFAGRLIAGGSIEQSLRVRLPRTAGRSWLVAETDANRALDEVLEDNNTAISATPLDIEPAYLTTLVIAPETVPSATPIPITGAATLRAGGPAAFVIVNIHIAHENVTRVISALTNSAGQFSTTFTPLPGDGGLFEFFATHPGADSAPVQDSVKVYGLKSEPASLDLRLSESSSQPGQLTVTNLTDLPLTGLQATVSGAPAGITFTATLAAGNLAGNGTVALNYTAAAQGPLARTTFNVSITSTQGATLQIPIAITVVANAPVLVAEPRELTAGMLRGQQQIVTFNLRNDGSAPSGPVNLLLPSAAPWLKTSTTLPIPAIAPGQSVPVTIQLTPPIDLALGDHSGALLATDGTSRLSIPFTFRALSDQLGQLIVRTEDEYTYYATGSPPLGGASVKLTDALTHVVVATIVTGANGAADFGSIPEGYYEIEATADRHASYRATHLLRGGITNHIPAFLSRQTVTYTWKVEAVQIEDRYKVTIDTTFETVVPIPVVTVEPTVIDLSQITTDEAVVNIKVTNHGLLAAGNTRLAVPVHPLWTFTPAIDQIGTLPAMSSITVPMTIRRVGAGGGGGGAGGFAAPPPDFGPCHTAMTVCWELICGTLRNTYCATIAVPNAAPGCGGTPPGPGGCTNCGGNSGPGGDTYVGPATVVTPTPCDPCLLKRLLAALECAIKWIPYSSNKDVEQDLKCIQDVMKCGKELSNGLGRADIYKCGKAVVKCRGQAKKILKFLKVVECACDLLTACRDVPGHDKSGVESGAEKVCDFFGITSPGGGGGGAAAFEAYPELVPLYNQAFRVRAVADYLAHIYGTYNWMRVEDGELDAADAWLTAFGNAIDETSDGGEKVSATERLALFSLPLPSAISAAEATRMVDRWNRSFDYWGLGIRTVADVPAGQSTDFIAVDVMRTLATAADVALAESAAAGYSTPDNGVSVEIQRVKNFYVSAPSTGGICARIKLRLEQDAVLTRDAFRAALEIENKGASPLQNVRVDVTVRTLLGSPVTSLFSVNLEGTTGVSAVNGTGVLPANSTGSARWLLIPTVDAAPDAPTQYLVGGILSYRVDGQDLSIPFSEVTITVLPSPRLALKYFHQRDVFSDDPFTAPIEPAIPYTLAVMVENQGFGVAKNFTITSAQPKIIENEKGLLADFQIIATRVDGQPLQPSLTANFGNIAPGQIRIGEWLMTSTLQGLFIDYKATFEHIDGRGNPRLSLIDSVEIHEMIHPVRELGLLDDGKPDYLVNDVPDVRDLPDTIHFSDGTTAPVALRETAQTIGVLSPANLTIGLTATMPAGWTYLRIPEPSNGQFVLQRVVRADGLEIPIDVNTWVTDRTFIGLAQRPVYENILHLLDENSPGSYTLVYALAAGLDTIAPVSRVLPLPAQSAIELPVAWEGTDNRRVAAFDVYVSANGAPAARWLQGTRDTGAVFAGTLGSSYAFYTRAIDAAGNVEAAPAIADATTTVTLLNIAPTLAAVLDQSVNEGATLTLQLAGNDPDGRADLLRFSFAAPVPPGLTIDAQTGLLRWVTGEADGGRDEIVPVRVTDSGVPAQSATRTFHIRVFDQNQPPVFAPVEPQRIAPGQPLILQLQADDADIPAQTIRYRFTSPTPGPMMLDVVSGRITWTPSVADADRTFAVAVTAADNGTPALETTVLVSITVDPANLDRPPQFLANPAQLWFIGTTRTLEIGAFDPDGDAVTMALNGPGLPAGLTLSSTPGTGRALLSWNTAGLTPGVYALPIKATANAAQSLYAPTVKLVNDNAYWRWADANLSSLADLSNADPTQDPDGDGTGNIHEWTFLRDPRIKDSTRTAVALEGPYDGGFYYANLSVHRRRGSNQFVTLIPQSSATLAGGTWSDLATTDFDATLDPNGDDDHDPETEEVAIRVLFQLTLDGANDKKFFRLKSATRPTLP